MFIFDYCNKFLKKMLFNFFNSKFLCLNFYKDDFFNNNNKKKSKFKYNILLKFNLIGVNFFKDIF